MEISLMSIKWGRLVHIVVIENNQQSRSNYKYHES